MGFKEIEGPMVESAFWNMDIMWIPQDHPARDEQDTFYLDGECDVSKELVEKVDKDRTTVQKILTKLLKRGLLMKRQMNHLCTVFY